MKKIDTVYSSSADITFIMEETYNASGEITTTEFVGWYYGEPTEEANKAFKGKLKANYEW